MKKTQFLDKSDPIEEASQAMVEPSHLPPPPLIVPKLEKLDAISEASKIAKGVSNLKTSCDHKKAVHLREKQGDPPVIAEEEVSV